MSDESESQEYQNFTALLKRIVSVPRAEIKRRMQDEEMTKEWVRDNDQTARRHRPIVSPALAADAKPRRSSRRQS